MKYRFSKFQGTGNDFIILDGKKSQISLTSDQVKHFCDRRFGVGADGLIILEKDTDADFKMLYYNADGKEGSMCGNGGRCIVQYAHAHEYIKMEATFRAVDGIHKAYIKKGTSNYVSLLMNDVVGVETNAAFTFLDTGSPHYVQFVSNVDSIDVIEEGRKIRNSERFVKEGVNVNFVEVNNDHLFVRTYERGVEDETLSCGTGVTAAVIAAHASGKINVNNAFKVLTRGGELNILFNKVETGYKSIYLEGPATFVFEGELSL